MSNKDFIVDLTEKGLFSGLYNTIWLHDETLNEYLEELAEDLKKRYNRDIKVEFSISFKKYLEEIAEVYINCFEKEISNSKWKIERISSPREYNFDTDHIILKWINAPSNAEEIFKNYLETIKKDSEINDYDIFEIHKIFSEYNGCEIIYELAQICDNQFNIAIYNEQGELELKPENEVENDKQN